MAKKSITKNYLYNLTYQILILILPLVTTPYISRVLGAEAIGIYSYTYNIVSYFILFGSLGVALYGQREIAYIGDDEKARKKTFIEIVSFRFIVMVITILIYFIVFANGEQYQTFYRIWMLELFATALDISWFFQGMEEFKKTVIRNIMVRLTSVSLIFIFVKSPEDLIKYITIYAVADLLGNLSLWLYLPKYLKGKKVGNINIFRHFAPIILLFIPQIANQIYNMIDKTMIGKIIEDKSEVGYYEQAQKITRVLLTVVTSLGTVMIPRMASVFASGNKKKVNDYMRKSFNFVFFLAFPITFGIMSISTAFVPWFFGAGYDKVVTLINVISPIILFTGMANVVGTQYLLPTKRIKEYTISISAGLIVNSILNYILISMYKSIGASIATIISEAIVVIIQLYIIRKDISLEEIIKLSNKYLISGLVMLVACLIVRRFLTLGLVSIIIQVAVGIIVYLIMLIILKDKFLSMFVNLVKEKLLKQKSKNLGI